MSEKSQKALKSASKAVYVLTIIAKVVIIIAAIFGFLVGLFLLCVMNNIEYNAGELKVKGSENSIRLIEEVEEEGAKVWHIKTGDTDLATIKDKNQVAQLEDFLNDEPIEKIRIVAIIGLVFGLVDVVVYVYMLNAVEKLFKNIRHEDTPFISDNVKLIRRIGYSILIILLIGIVFTTTIELALKMELRININYISIIEAIMVFAFGYIFEYGCKLQEGSDKKIYDVKD